MCQHLTEKSNFCSRFVWILPLWRAEGQTDISPALIISALLPAKIDAGFRYVPAMRRFILGKTIITINHLNFFLKGTDQYIFKHCRHRNQPKQPWRCQIFSNRKAVAELFMLDFIFFTGGRTGKEGPEVPCKLGVTLHLEHERTIEE